jgi:hypothetical protein
VSLNWFDRYEVRALLAEQQKEFEAKALFSESHVKVIKFLQQTKKKQRLVREDIKYRILFNWLCFQKLTNFFIGVFCEKQCGFKKLGFRSRVRYICFFLSQKQSLMLLVKFQILKITENFFFFFNF